jgi:hypothetical protein
MRQMATIRKVEEVRAIPEADILKEFMPYWSKKMKKYGKESEITEDNCISDWAILRWAHKNDQDMQRITFFIFLSITLIYFRL